MYNALLYKKYPEQYRHKIQSRPPLNYYGMVLLVVVMVPAVLLGKSSLVILSLSIWLLLIARLVFKRLPGTSHSASHIAEMIVTSMIKPFAPVFWQLYGARRFRVLFF
jgi:hypothetical protein